MERMPFLMNKMLALIALTLALLATARPCSGQQLETKDLATGGQTPAGLVARLLGPGLIATNIQYTGHPIQAGLFTGGCGIIGINEGIILSSGDIAGVIGPRNTGDGWTGAGVGPGDPDLTALVTQATRDATILEFDLVVSTSSVLSFDFVFASEEYDGKIPHYDDVTAIFLNGVNIAVVPGTNVPVSVNNVNCGNPYNWPNGGTNCALYRTNDCYTFGLLYPCTTAIATETNGLTVVLTASGTLVPGQNHIKLAIADAIDNLKDCNVFIRASCSASCGGKDFCLPGVDVMTCPCGNVPATTNRGCNNTSLTGGGTLSSTGVASLGNDTLKFTAVDMTTPTLAVLYQSRTTSPTTFGHGVNCLSGNPRRIYTTSAPLGTAIFGSGAASQSGWLPISHQSCALAGECIRPCSTRYYQVRYRDAGLLGSCPPASNLNATQAQSVVWY